MNQTSVRHCYADQVDLRFRVRLPACNDNSWSGCCCPRCNAVAAAPFASEYRGSGLIQHHWLCTHCGHEWVTALRVAH